MMILSFFEVYDVLPFANQISLYFDGQEYVLTQEEQESLKGEIFGIFENSHTLPALGVITNNEFQEELQKGVYVSIRFETLFEINGLPFDQLVFKVEKDSYAFNIYRGIDGVFEGRCIYVDLNGKTLDSLMEAIKIENGEQKTLSQI